MLEARISFSLAEREPVRSVCEGVSALLGYAPDEFLSGRVRFRDLIHPHDLDIAERLFSAGDDASTGSFNIRLRHADGRIRCLRGSFVREATAGGVLDLHLQDAKSLARPGNGSEMMANFKAMMEITDDYIYFKDRNHVFTGASQTLVAITDPSEHWTDLIGLTDYDVFPEAYADIYYRLEKQVFAGMPVAQEIQQTLDNQGRRGWVDNRKYPILDERREIVGLFGIARDITARIDAETALRASERKFHSLYVSMTEGVALHEVVLGAEGEPVDYRLLDANPAFEAITGLARANVLGHLASEVYGTGQAPFLDAYAAVAMTGEPVSFVSAFEPMGKVFTISVFCPVRGQFATIFKDVSEERRLQMALRDSEQRYRTFAAGTFEGIAVSIAGRVHDANNQLLEMLGYARDELLGLSIVSLVPESEREAVLGDLGQGREHFGEHHLVRKDGRLILVESHGQNILFDGQAARLTVIRDITAVRAAEQRLRESEARFRRMFEDNSSIMLLVAPESGELLDANAAAAEFYGYPVEQLKAMNIRQINTLTADELVGEIAKARQNRQRFFVFEHRLASGELRTVEIRSSSIVADGRPVLFSIINDITERRQAESALQASEERFRQLFDHAEALSIQGYTADGTVCYWNGASEKIYGYGAGEAIGRSLYDLIIPESRRDEVMQAVQRMFETGHAVPSGRLPMRHKDGHAVPVYSSHTVVRVEGQPAILFCMDIDLGDLERAEEQVRKLSEAVAQNPNAILITDTAGRIEYANAAFTVTTGYSFAEACGRPADFLGAATTSPEVVDQMWQTISAGRIWRGELVNRRKDGSEQVVFAHVAPIREADGEVSHYVAIHDDITEKKRNAEELERYRHHLEELLTERSGDLIRANAELVRARDAAEAASRAKSVFLANMSHELRTPMNAIMGMTELAQRRATDARQIDHLAKVGLASRQLLGIINDILDMAKIESEQFVLDETEFTLSELMQQLRDLLGPTAHAKGLALLVDLDQGLAGQPLHGDPLRVSQVFLNLTSNAIKFTARGSVTVAVRAAAESADDILLHCSVRDTGIGIRPEDQARLFNAFEQVDASMTRKFGGTGLGLAISRQLTSMMGGEIGVDSSLGAGSTFWFTLRLAKARPAPVLPARVAEETAEARLRSQYIGTRILLVEDEPINRELTLCLLEEAGLVVDLAEDGGRAVEMAGQNRYALILMDLQMPVLNGLDASRAIRRLPGRENTPILALTANAFEDDKQLSQDAGMNDFLAKPIVPRRLFEIVLQWLDRESGKNP